MKIINFILQILKCFFLLAALYGFSLFISDLTLPAIVSKDAFMQLNPDSNGLGVMSARMLPIEFDLFNIFSMDKTFFYPLYVSSFLTMLGFAIPTKNTVDVWKRFFTSYLKNEATH